MQNSQSSNSSRPQQSITVNSERPQSEEMNMEPAIEREAAPSAPMQNESAATRESAPARSYEEEAIPTLSPLKNSEKALPRDVLIAKAKAYREQQGAQMNQEPQQLSMAVDDGADSLHHARRLAEEVVKSPFDADNLDVPAYLRRHKDGDLGPL